MSKITMLYDNGNWDYYEECARDMLDDNPDVDEYSVEAVNDYVYRLMDWDWDDLLYDLRNFFGNKECIIFGILGRWNANYNVWHTGTFDECLNKALDDCNVIQIWDADGHLYISGFHHDGSNHFEIKLLKESGEEYLDRWNWSDDDRTNEDVCKQLVKRHTLCPHFAKKRWV